MSGFLQRLARGVLHSERAIHPDVGSIWSAQRGADAIELSSEALVQPTPHHAIPLTPSQVPPIRAAMMRERAPHREAVQPPSSGMEPNVADAAAFKPLVGPPQQDPVYMPVAIHPTEAAQHDDAILPTHQNATPPEFSTVQRPLWGESPRPPIPALRIPAPVGVTARESSRVPRQSQPAQPPASEPDAIEIHIGRIEVLAAPQRPAQPAAPSPARKSLDLGEYLRRDRRAR